MTGPAPNSGGAAGQPPSDDGRPTQRRVSFGQTDEQTMDESAAAQHEHEHEQHAQLHEQQGGLQRTSTKMRRHKSKKRYVYGVWLVLLLLLFWGLWWMAFTIIGSGLRSVDAQLTHLATVRRTPFRFLGTCFHVVYSAAAGRSTRTPSGCSSTLSL